jgi:hypothetical protein
MVLFTACDSCPRTCCGTLRCLKSKGALGGLQLHMYFCLHTKVSFEVVHRCGMHTLS